MNLVSRPMWEPFRCAFTLKDQDPEGFVVGQTMKGFDPHAFASVSWIKQTARELGMVDPTDLVERVAALDAQLEQVTAERDDLTQQIAAVEVLKNTGKFEQARRPGRPKTKETSNG